MISTYLVNDGHLVPDIEGIAVVHDDYGSFLLASSQGDSAFGVYALELLTAPYELLRKFRVSNGDQADGCQPDNTNSEPATTGNQDFKFVPLDDIVPGINPYEA